MRSFHLTTEHRTKNNECLSMFEWREILTICSFVLQYLSAIWYLTIPSCQSLPTDNLYTIIGRKATWHCQRNNVNIKATKTKRNDNFPLQIHHAPRRGEKLRPPTIANGIPRTQTVFQQRYNYQHHLLLHCICYQHF